MPGKHAPPEERFWAKVNKNGPIPENRPGLGQCWLWTGRQIGAGYGGFLGRNGRTTYGHRFAYELLIGAVPEGFEIDHLCRNRMCVNPTHMEVVTHLENVRRGRGPKVAGRWQRARTHCPQGHPYDLFNTYIYKGARQCRACHHVWTHRYDVIHRAERVVYDRRRRAKSCAIA